MSWKKYSCGDPVYGGKPDEGHRKKICVCGGHSSNDHKKNINHNATKKRLDIQKRADELDIRILNRS